MLHILLWKLFAFSPPKQHPAFRFMWINLSLSMVVNYFSLCSMDWFLQVRTKCGKSWPLVAVPCVGNVFRALKSKGKRHLWGWLFKKCSHLQFLHTYLYVLVLLGFVCSLPLYGVSLFFHQDWNGEVWAEMVQVFETWPKPVLYYFS